jgi:hypothetical protein
LIFCLEVPTSAAREHLGFSIAVTLASNFSIASSRAHTLYPTLARSFLSCASSSASTFFF